MSSVDSRMTAAGNAVRIVVASDDWNAGPCSEPVRLLTVKITVSRTNRDELGGSWIAIGSMFGGARLEQLARLKHIVSLKIDFMSTTS